MRRRLAWLGGALVVAGGIVGLVLAFPSPKPSAADKMLKAKARVVKPQKHASFAPRAAGVIDTARGFIVDGVTGKNLDASWKFVAPKMRAGFTRRTWDHGPSLPFQLYPADLPRTRFNVTFSYTDEVAVRILLFARSKTKVRPRRIAFDLVERKYGHGANTRWLVSSFTPAPSANGDSGGSTASQAAVDKAVAEERHTSAVWLFVPLGIFGSLVVGLTLFFSIRAWRHRVAYRAYFENRQTSSWRPS
jgi:hypothetical protein